MSVGPFQHVPPSADSPQFRLRTLFIVITFFAAPSAWIFRERQQSERELGIAHELEKLDMLVERRTWLGNEYDEAWWQSPINELLGERVSAVYTNGHDTPEKRAGLKQLSTLSCLENLSINQTNPETLDELSFLAKLGKLRGLHLSGVYASSRSPLPLPQGLSALTLNDADRFDLSALKQVSGLKFLKIHCNSLGDLTPLGDLLELEELHLALREPASFDLLSRLKHLKRLKLRQCDGQLGWIAGLESLEEFDSTTPELQNLKPFGNLRYLKKLVLHRSQVSDLTPLASLNNLQSLALTSAPITDLGVIPKIRSLEELVVPGTRITNLDPLVNAKALRSLFIGGTAINDLTPLHSLKTLRSIGLGGMETLDFKTVSGLSTVEYIDLTGTKLGDLVPLSKLPNLTTLVLMECTVNDLSPLQGMRQLNYVALYSAQVDDAQVAQLRQARPQCYVADFTNMRIP